MAKEIAPNEFKGNDVLHHISGKFVHTHLPDAKKPYNLKVVHPPVLGVHEVASKAESYNYTTPAKVIEEGLSVGLNLIARLVADGYQVETILFILKTKIPGEYTGTETHLPDGVFPVAKLQVSPAFRKFLKERTTVHFDGYDTSEGHIAEAWDEASGTEEICTMRNLLTIRGSGLKIESDEAHKDEVGLFFCAEGNEDVKTEIIAVNEPRTLKVIVPYAKMEVDTAYTLKVVTQSSARDSYHLLKELRTVKSDFTLIAHL